MSETRSQQEPSMEEILASIRRIISEDGQESEAKTEQDEAAEPEPAAEPSTPKGNAEEPRPDAGASGADVLVLTEMLADDGSVVSLAAQSAGGADLSAMSATGGLPEPPGGPPDNPDETTVSESSTPAGAGMPSQPDRTEPNDRRSDAESVPPPMATVPSNSADQQMENETVSNDARKKLDLISQETETASTTALSELARTVARDKEIPMGGGRMVEDLVRESLQPMLREWLDANLPGLVERLVRSEIQRMVRRAEDNT